MNIKILGSGCPNCIKLEKNTIQAVEELKLDADIDHVFDISEILNYGIMSMPALLINEKEVISGKIASIDEIKEILKQYD